MLDEDLARLYGVTTGQLNQALKRNRRRFPRDFAFQLTAAECRILKSQSVISSGAHGGRRTRPYAFTEHGAIMAASILNTMRRYIRARSSESIAPRNVSVVRYG